MFFPSDKTLKQEETVSHTTGKKNPKFNTNAYAKKFGNYFIKYAKNSTIVSIFGGLCSLVDTDGIMDLLPVILYSAQFFLLL